MEIGVSAFIEIAPGAKNAAGRKHFQGKKSAAPVSGMCLAKVFCAKHTLVHPRGWR